MSRQEHPIASETEPAHAGSVERLVRRKRPHKNEIRFNCTAYVRLYYSQPANCYNCVRRNGYPQNLGGDKNCENYSPNNKLSDGGGQ
jgi:hypothetical protein